jgi:hypothetical protein
VISQVSSSTTRSATLPIARELDADVAPGERALAVDGDRRHEVPRPGNPAPRVDHQVAHVPVLVVEVEVVDRPDLAVLGVDRVALQVLDLVEHVVIPEASAAPEWLGYEPA